MIKKFGAVAVLFVLCSAIELSAAVNADKTPDPVVVIKPSVHVTSLYALKYPGKIKPIDEVAIVPRATGIILEQNFREGALVKCGTLLFKLEDTAYQAQVDNLKANIVQIQATLQYAAINLKRQSKLYRTKAISQVTFDIAMEKLSVVKGKLDAAKAKLRDAENTLSYTKIYAPITGKIGKCALTKGNLVTSATGTLVTITKIAPIYVEFAIGENTFRSFGGMKGFADKADIRVELADRVIYPETAKVAIIDPKVDESTNTIKIWGVFQNKDTELLPGSYVTVLLRPRKPSHVVGVLPSALQADKAGSYVYVMKNNGTAEKRRVLSGNVNGDILEIKSGLQPGEIVVVDGMHKIRPGLRVKTVPYRK